MRFELMTSSLPRRRSTPELRGRRKFRIANFGFQNPAPQKYDRQSASPRTTDVSSRMINIASFCFIPTFGAGDETRTRDPQLGRLMLYQLSYTRPRRLLIADFGMRIENQANHISIIRSPTNSELARVTSYIRPICIPQSQIRTRLVQGAGFEPA